MVTKKGRHFLVGTFVHHHIVNAYTHTVALKTYT